ncbi:hypothetical protein BJP48_31590 [Paenibacillus odorifer]|nr:hypothetical protein BJP48_31590 [Paenibacillus odorifer]
MNKARIERILQNAEKYRTNTLGIKGHIIINHSQTENQVIVSSELQDFTIQELQQIIVILMKMTVNEGDVAIVENDYFEIWSFVNYLIINSRKKLDSWFHNYNPLVAHLTSNICQEIKPKYIDQQNREYQNRILDSNSSHSFPMVWSGYAYLEGICRRICSSYVTTEGRILHDFELDGGKYEARRNINSLKVMLNLTKAVVSNSTKNQLDEIFSIYTPNMIYKWRNSTLHGAGDIAIPVIVIYSLISILSLELLIIINRDE